MPAIAFIDTFVEHEDKHALTRADIDVAEDAVDVATSRALDDALEATPRHLQQLTSNAPNELRALWRSGQRRLLGRQYAPGHDHDEVLDKMGARFNGATAQLLFFEPQQGVREYGFEFAARGSAHASPG